jgi:hypothetical protein
VSPIGLWSSNSESLTCRISNLVLLDPDTCGDSDGLGRLDPIPNCSTVVVTFDSKMGFDKLKAEGSCDGLQTQSAASYLKPPIPKIQAREKAKTPASEENQTPVDT